MDTLYLTTNRVKRTSGQNMSLFVCIDNIFILASEKSPYVTIYIFQNRSTCNFVQLRI
jgi:hypothetical protein